MIRAERRCANVALFSSTIDARVKNQDIAGRFSSVKTSGNSPFPLDEFLKPQIAAERIEHRIELEECRSQWHARGETAVARYRKYFL